PCDASALRGALEAARHGMITPVLVGPQAKIQAVALAEGLDLTGYRIVHTEHSHAAAEAAVAMARSGEVQALMKGSLH
ncbi:enoyl-CoA hydratase, partial [Acinetobacter baumannii]